MLRGLNALTLDAKGRFAIPSRYRECLQDDDSSGLLILTINTEERCLWLYPDRVWQEIEKKLIELPSFHPAARRIQRLLIGHATELEMDRSGRVLLPALLREYAGLDKSIMMVGQGNKFEIWCADQWRSAREAWLADGVHEDDIPGELQSISL